MDPELLRHIDFFAQPNNQTANPADRGGNLGVSTPQQQSPWDAPGPSSRNDINESPSTAETTFSFDSFTAQAPASGTGASFSGTQRNPHRNQGRTILPTRPSRVREGHDRKRSKLSTDTTPFDSVDYWIQFDGDEALAEELGGSGARRVGQEGAARSTHSLAMPPPRTVPARARPSNSGQKTGEDNDLDDSALDNALSDDDDFLSTMNLAEHLSQVETEPPAEVPPREGLYSTPLSWEKPQPGLRVDSLIGLQSPMLTESEQRRLIAIAMNPGPTMGGLGSNVGDNYRSNVGPRFGMGLDANSWGQFANMPGPSRAPQFSGPQGSAESPYNAQPQSQPQSQPQAPGRPPIRRTQSAQSALSVPSTEFSGLSQERGRGPQTATDKGKEKIKPGDRTAHNDIEKKYRTNLKDKIAELRDAVPALRTIPEEAEDEGDDGQPSRGPKASKGTVLTKATEYIHYLERKNKNIMQQHQDLSKRLQAFEQLLSATARPTYQMPNYSRTLFDPRAFC